MGALVLSMHVVTSRDHCRISRHVPFFKMIARIHLTSEPKSQDTALVQHDRLLLPCHAMIYLAVACRTLPS